MTPTGARPDASAAAARAITPVTSLRHFVSTLHNPTNLIFLVVGITVAFLALYPTVFLFYGSFTDAPIGIPGKLTLKNYLQVFSDRETYSLMVNSICFALGSSTFSLLIGLALAWITVRTNAPFKALFELTAIIPNVLPGLLVAISWVFLLNPTNGLLNAVCEHLIGIRPFNIYSVWGLIWVEGLITAPVAYLILAAALKGMDPALEEAAKVSGSSEVGLTWKVTFPLVRPAILAAWTLNFVRAIESFDTPAIIAVPARFEVFTTKIFREAMGSFPSNHNLAATFAVALLAIAFFLVYIYRRMTSRVERYATVSGKAFSSRTTDLGRWRSLAAVVAFVLLIVMVLFPLLTLLLISFLPYYFVPTFADLPALTFKHYHDIIRDDRVLTALWNSLRLAIGGASLCMILATLISYITVKTKIFGRQILEALAFIPWAFPGAALAMGLLWAYVDFPVPVFNTLWILLIAYISRFLPYGLRATNSTIIQIHNELEEASVACGAGFAATFRRIVVPLMGRGIVAGWILLVTQLMREFGTSIFLYSPGAEPLGPLIFFLYQDSRYGAVAVLGLLLCVVSIIIVGAGLRFARLKVA